MTSPDAARDEFYDGLLVLLATVSKTDKLIVLGNFNAHDGTNHAASRGVLGSHEFNGSNGMGLLLLRTSGEHQLILDKNFFYLLRREKANWMFLRLLKSTALAVLSSARRRHEDQLDNNEAAINDLFSGKNRLHKAYVEHPTEDSKAAFYRSHPLVRQRLRRVQNAWTASKTEQIQGYADRSEWTMFFSAIEAVYGPQANDTASFLSTNYNFLLTKMTQILQIWAENCRGVLCHTPNISDAAIAYQPQVETNIGPGPMPSLHETIRAL
nr:unnamed protein product [Spirometra erinaceieuropaei]